MLKSTCSEITRDMMNTPIGALFSIEITDDILPGYTDLVSKPMDLRQVLNKIETDRYANISEWYNDMELVFNNAITFYKQDTVYYMMAKTELEIFHKKTKSLSMSKEEWTAAIQKKMGKLASAVFEAPVSMGYDHVLQYFIRLAGSQSPLPAQKVSELVAKLNVLIADKKISHDIIYLLKSTGYGVDINQRELTLDAAKMSDVTVNALSLYANAYH